MAKNAQKPWQRLAAWLACHRVAYPTDRAFAAAAGCSRGRLSQILGGAGGQVSPPLAISLHKITDGAVPGNAWRPDLWRTSADVPVSTGGRQ